MYSLRYGVVGVLFTIGVWQILSLFQFKLHVVPSPIDTCHALKDILISKNGEWVFGKDDNIYENLGETLRRVSIGLGLAIVVGVLLGLVLGKIKMLRLMFEGVIDFFRSIPVTALYQIFVVYVIGDNSQKVAMIFWGCLFVISINATYGVLQANPIRQKMAKLYGATNFQVFSQVLFYDALPQIFVGLRVAVSYALIIAILTEMFMGSTRGIGKEIGMSAENGAYPKLFACIIITGLVGFIINKIFILTEKRIVGWKYNAN